MFPKNTRHPAAPQDKEGTLRPSPVGVETQPSASPLGAQIQALETLYQERT